MFGQILAVCSVPNKLYWINDQKLPIFPPIDQILVKSANVKDKNRLNRVMHPELVLDTGKYTSCSVRVMSQTKFKA
jgi:hypothetical protein